MNETIIGTLVSQYADGAPFLWLLRDAAVGEPHFDLADLAELDDRLEAHLDGLRIAGDAGWEACKEELAWEEPGEIFTVAHIAFERSDDVGRIQEVLEAAKSTVECERGLVSALGWIPYDTVEARVEQLVGASAPELRRLGIGAMAAHRRDPGDRLSEGLTDEDTLLRARALKAAGQLGRADLLPAIRDHLKDDDPLCSLWASWSAALVGEAAAVGPLKNITVSDSEYRQLAMDMAMRRMGHADALAWQSELAQTEETMRLAVIGAGVIGDPTAVPWLLERMAVPELARVAGEAFTMMTGVDLVYDDLEREEPEGFEAGPTENPEDEDVAMDPDEDLPWPDSALIGDWWNQNKNNFPPGKRYLIGKPQAEEWLNEVLRTGRQRQRAAAALELAILHPEKPLFEVRAPGFRQQAILGTRRVRSE